MQFNFRADLAAEKSAALEAIDAAAESVRSLFVTTAPAQMLVYSQKQAEALALVANPTIAEADTPHLVAEASALGTSRFQVANSIIAMATQWRTVSAQIEARRIAAKEAVRAAGNVFLVRDARAVDWSDIVALSG